MTTAEPICPRLREELALLAGSTHIPVRNGATYGCVEGPRLGTKAESFFLRQAGCELVGMTAVPEVFLAREAQICYASLAVATDYDCWNEQEEHAQADQIVQLYAENLSKVTSLIAQFVGYARSASGCSCRKVLESSFLSPEDGLTDEQKRIRRVLLG